MTRCLPVLALLLALAPGAFARGDDDAPVDPLRIVGPRLPAEREAMRSKLGWTKSTEKAVAAGLDWLARHELPDGGWDADLFPERCTGEKCTGLGKGQHAEEIPCPFDDAISAMVVLAFLGHGHLPDADGDPYGKLVARGLKRLERTHSIWGLTIATQAFAEAEAMEGKGRFKKQALDGARRLMQLRLKDGGWAYLGNMRGGGDLPFTALVVQALIAARDAGFDLPRNFGRDVSRFLDTLEESKGRLAYLRTGRDYGYTPTTSNGFGGAAIRELVRAGTDGARHKSHMALIAKRKPLWKISFKEVTVRGRKSMIQMGHLSMYQWWYGSIACFHAGGSTWSAYHGKVKGALLSHQEKGTGCDRGSWEPIGTYSRQTGGRVFATALGVLMLEQPYRHRVRGE